jgi:hypothetical protein
MTQFGKGVEIANKRAHTGKRAISGLAASLAHVVSGSRQ